MDRPNYPANWDSLRRSVIRDHMNQCANCHKVGGLSELQVHHIVPVSQAGTHRPSNLVPLCSTCHAAAHQKTMAPRVRWYTKRELSDDEFATHKELWQKMREQLGVPRYDPDDQCVYVPVADKERIIDEVVT